MTTNREDSSWQHHQEKATTSSETRGTPPFTASLSSLASIAAGSLKTPTERLTTSSQPPKAKSMELPSVLKLLDSHSPRTSGSAAPRRLSTLPKATAWTPRNILDFDVETVAAGFADPNWVPQKITCVAWSWVGSDNVQSRICGPVGLFGDSTLRAEMLAPLLEAISKADMVTGHNLLRFDLPVINAECLRLGLEPIRKVLVQDTMRFVRSKGFKKGQDNIGELLRLRNQKMSLSWQGWQDAYDEEGWRDIIARAETDVIMHKEMRLGLIERNILKPPVMWRA